MSRRPLSLVRVLGLSVLCLGLALGCGGGSTPTPPQPKPLPDASRSTVEVSRASGVLADGEERVDITVTVRQEDGSAMEGRTVRVEVSGEGNTVTQPAGKTDAQGRATASVVSTRAGTKTVTASVDAEGGAVVLGSRPTIAFNAPVATRLAFTATALAAVAGAPIGNLEVTLKDAAGRTVAGATDEVTLSLAAGPGDATLEGTLTARAVAGVVRFSEVVLKHAGSGYQLKVEASGLEGATSPTFAVAPAAAASLEVSGLPAVTSAGVAQRAVVTVRDAFGNVATGYTGTLVVTSTDATAVLPEAHAFSAGDAGRFTFTGITLRRAGSQHVTVRDGANAALTAEQEVGVVAGPAAALAFTEAPSRASVRAVLSTVRVEVQDTFGNRAAVGSPLVSLSLAPGASGLEGVLSAMPVDGVASFTLLRVNAEGQSQLVASAEGLAPATSAPLDIVDDVPPATPSLLAGTSTPTSVTVTWVAVGDDGAEGRASSQELRYSVSPIITDALFDAATPVEVGAPLEAGLDESATVSGLDPGRTYHVALRVTDNRGNAARSASLVVQSQNRQVTRLAFITQPSSGTAGADLAEVRVALQDDSGVVVTTATSPVTLSLVGHPEFTPVTVTAVDGVASFNGLRVNAAGEHHFSASANGLTPVESEPFVVQAAGPVRLALTGLVGPVTAGAEGSLVVTAYDRFENVATGYQGTVRFTSNDTQATLPAEYTFTAGDAGRHTFNGVRLHTAGLQRVTVVDAANAQLTDGLEVEVASEAAVRLMVSGLPADVTAGDTQRITVSARDGFGNIVTGYTGTVRFTSTDSQAVLPGDYTFTAADAGDAEFPVTLRSAGPQTVNAEEVGGSGLRASAETRVAPGAATQMTVALSTTTPFAGQAVEATVTVLDASGNRVPGYRGRVGFQVLDDPEATVPGNYTFTEEDRGQRTFSVTFVAVRNSMLMVDEPAGALRAEERVTVRPGLLRELRVVRAPRPVVAGQPQDFTVTAYDGFGNVKTDYLGTVATTSTDPNPGELESHTYTELDRGVYHFRATFRTAGPQSLTFTDSEAGVSGEDDVTVDAAEPVRLVFVTVAETGIVRQPLAQTRVALRDTFGNTARVSFPAVTMTLSGGPAGTTFGGTHTVDPVDGVAVFSDLTVDQEGEYRLMASTEDRDISSVDGWLSISDTVAPAPASGFSASVAADNRTVQLAWVATGDDGTEGRAARYELRFSHEPIDADNFGGAINMSTGTPGTPGSAEATTREFPAARATWYFALRVVDSAGNASALALTSVDMPGPCGGVVCEPRAAECAPDDQTLITYTGMCVENGNEPQCDYTPTYITCEGQDAVCYAGACDTAAPPAAGELVISEVMHSPSAGTTEYLELTNTTDRLLNVTNMVVTYDNGVDGPESFAVQTPWDAPRIVAGGETFVAAYNDDEATNGGVPADYSYFGGFALGDSGRLTLEVGGTTLVDELVYTPVDFPQAPGSSMNLSSVVLATPARHQGWYWCDSSAVLPGGDRGTPGQANETCSVAISPPVDFCVIQAPKSIPDTVVVNTAQTITSRFRDEQITTRNRTGNDRFPLVVAELGYGTDANAPEGWTWGAALPNPGYTVVGGSDEDETVGSLSIGTPGSYVYGFRYRFTQGPPGAQDWVYCDQNGVVQAGNPVQYGTVTVVPPPPTNTITSVNYPVIARGAELVLTGTGFTGATSVTVGSVAQTFTVNSNTQITIAALDDSTPVGATQPILVTKANGPGTPRNVTVINLVISEVDSDTAENPETTEFVEISTGVPGINLSGYALVLFNGNGALEPSYYAVDLDVTTDGNGRVLVGNTGVAPRPAIIFPSTTFLQNGADAVALYQAPASAFPNGTPATANRLIDALVYSNAPTVDTGLLDALLWAAPDPRRVQVNEATGGTAPTLSIQRCGTGRRDGRVFRTAAPTVGADNTCP